MRGCVIFHDSEPDLVLPLRRFFFCERSCTHLWLAITWASFPFFWRICPFWGEESQLFSRIFWCNFLISFKGDSHLWNWKWQKNVWFWVGINSFQGQHLRWPHFIHSILQGRGFNGSTFICEILPDGKVTHLVILCFVVCCTSMAFVVVLHFKITHNPTEAFWAPLWHDSLAPGAIFVFCRSQYFTPL